MRVRFVCGGLTGFMFCLGGIVAFVGGLFFIGGFCFSF